MSVEKIRRRFITYILMSICFLGEGSIRACSWCKHDDMATFIRDKLTLLKVQALPQQAGASFYHECLYDYYPKVYVITHTYFTQMCPHAVDSALHEIVRILTYDTWFYFSN